MAPKQKERINLFQGALTYKDKRFEGYDAATIIEVIEHLDQNRLKSFESYQRRRGEWPPQHVGILDLAQSVFLH